MKNGQEVNGRLFDADGKVRTADSRGACLHGPEPGGICGLRDCRPVPIKMARGYVGAQQRRTPRRAAASRLVSRGLGARISLWIKNLPSLLTRDCQIGGTRAQRDAARKTNPITIAKKERAIHLNKEVSKKRKVVNAALQIFNGLKFRVLD